MAPVACPPPDSPGFQRRLPSLTSLRWVAACIVFLTHGDALIDGSSIQHAYHRLTGQGACSLTFFFVLSGFVLTWSRRPGDTVPSYIRRRVARIVPAYWAVCLITVPITYWLVRPQSGGDLFDLFFPFTLLQAWVPAAHVYFGGNWVSWSLSAEAFFYALFPLLVVSLLALGPKARGRVLLVLVAAAVSVPLIVHTREVSDGFLFWLTYINPGWRIVEFGIGICIAGLLQQGRRPPIGARTALGLALVAYLAAGWAPAYASEVAITLIPFTLVVWSCAAADLDGTAPRWLHARSMIHLGQWSYAFYLLHQLVIRVVARLGVVGHLPTTGDKVAYLVFAWLMAIAAAYLLFRFIEQPFERRIRRGGTATPQAELALAGT